MKNLSTMRFLQTYTMAAGLLGISLFAGCVNSNGQGKDEEGFRPMFDGKTLSNWRGDTKYWTVEDGTLTGEVTDATLPQLKTNTFLIWAGGRPGDFELKAEYRISKEGNSGINYRSEEVAEIPFALKGYQLDIDGKNSYTGQNYEERKRTTLAYRGQSVIIPLMEGNIESHLTGNAWTGAILNRSLGNADSLASAIRVNDWNEVHIIARDGSLKHFVNGILMSEVNDEDTVNLSSEGYIGLQLHAGMVMKINFRNLRIKDL